MRTSFGLGVVVAMAAGVLGACSASSSKGSGGSGASTSSTGSPSGSSSTGGGSATSSTSATSSSSSTSSGTSSTSSSTSSSSSSGSTGCHALTDDCTKCTFMDCNSLYCACYNDSDCGMVVSCVEGCSPADSGCVSNCFLGHSTGISEAALLDNCAATANGGACAGSCSGAAALTPCELCLFMNYTSDMDACLSDSTCSQFLTCAAACNGDSSCEDGCYFDNDDPMVDAITTDVGNCSACN